LKRLFLIVALVSALAGGALWWWARASLPQLDGELRVSGLTAPVEVLFDAHGVPHVYAAGPEDAWFAAGVLHARERLWQMELYRRAASGRLSEILGESTLPIDRRFLTLDLRGAAEAEWQAAPLAVRNALTRYAAGVNAQIAAATGRRRPIELQILGVTPAEWTPVDSLAVGRLLAWRLAENHQAELVRHALAARFGTTEALRLGGRYPASAPSVMQGLPPGPGTNASPAAPRHPRDLTSSASPGGEGVRSGLGDERWPAGLEWLRPGARRGGSNNWVIAGRRTASGRPLLANDPHLQIEFPGIWYEMHLVAAGLDVIGVTVPGTPFVILGHNARIAWGVTNTGADVQDLFVDRIDVGRRQYFFQGQWLPVQVARREIPVSGGATQVFEVWRTRHGSVFAEVGPDWEDAPAWLTQGGERRGEKRVFTLRWEPTGDMASAFEALNRAGSWPEFTAAIERFSMPSQNFVYADVDGNIGYAMSGVLPQRATAVGSMPNDGTTGEGEWTGSVPGSVLPRVFNPPRGYITSSNNLIDRQWPGLITRDWAAPYRATQLHRLIDPATRVDPAMSEQWQNDVTGLAAAAVLEGIESARALAHQRQNAAAANVLAELKVWDRRIDQRGIVTLYHLFEDALWRRTFSDEMGDQLFAQFYDWAGAERPSGLYALLDDPSSRWFDDIATIDRRETRDDIFMLAAEDASIRYRGEFAGRQAWSAAHQATFTHPLANASLVLGWLFSRGPVAVAGDAYTVNRTSYRRSQAFAVWEVPSWRQIMDVGQWDTTRVVLPGGQSGHPLSPYYFDQNEMWRTGQYRAQPYSRKAVDTARQHRLVLTP
jgi:penicillin amidase